MKHGVEQFRNDAAGREGVRRVLLAQYELHETRHHPASTGGAAEPIPTAPKAHTLADVYKCLHQGHFGIGHSIDDPVRFANLLAMDLLKAEPNDAEPVLENVSPTGSVFRVNLRPYRHRSAGRDEVASALLVEACLKSEDVLPRSEKDFIASLQWFMELNNSGELALHGRSFRFPADLLTLFLAQVNDFIRTSGTIPVLSHSPIYKRYNAPSYRVVDRAVLEQSALAPLLEEAFNPGFGCKEVRKG